MARTERVPGRRWLAPAVPYLPYLLYLLLTVLVWGLFAFNRGFFQDDAALLFAAFNRRGSIFAVAPSPTRLLLGIPYALALASGAPLRFLQSLGVLSWLGIGVAAHLLARRLVPERPGLAVLAGALTLTASSDYLTASLVALGYNLSILAFLLAVVCLLRWHGGGGGGWLAGAVALLSTSLWSTDAAPVVAVLIPGLLLLPGMARASRRRWVLTGAAWYGAILPYAWVLVRALTRPGEYVAGALLPLSWGVRALRLGKLFAYNFMPWMWAFHRRPWAPPLPALVPLWVKLGLAGVGVVGVWLVVGKNTDGGTDSGTDDHRLGWIFGACLGLTLAANATFASVQLAEVCYRTHLLSRVWASLALTALVGMLGASSLRRGFALLVAGLFVGLGIVGGLERQDFFLAYWQRHRTELRSILQAAPGVVPGTFLLLYAPTESPPIYRATQVDYLTRAWTILLYGRGVRSLLWTGCRAETTGFACPAVDRRQALLLPYSRLVLLTYQPAVGRYGLAAAIPPELLASGRADPAEVARYRPEKLVVHQPMTALAGDLLAP